jgi:predicted naringenin-chalcone synthase
LHLNPGLHSPEQLVIQSLFGDGLIKYGVSRDFPQGLEVLTLREEIVPDSESAMSWEVGDFGMVMSLARDVPDRLAKCLPDFFESLCDEIGIHSQQARSSALFAIHPGGPKIIDRIQDILGLSEEQVNASREILRANGNMSSATLPHIWKRILENPRVPSGQLVFTFGFGPGLTLSSGVLRKIG